MLNPRTMKPAQSYAVSFEVPVRCGRDRAWQGVPGQRMTWACEMYPDWSGPGRSFVTFTLEDRNNETVVKVEDAGVCINAQQAGTSLNTGWHELIGTHFKNYVEAAPWSAPPRLTDSGPLGLRYGELNQEDS